MKFLYYRIELPNLNELGDQGMIPGFEGTNISTNADDEKKKYRVDIPGFARYRIINQNKVHMNIILRDIQL